ncbi:MAG: DUF2452 domain-containing protein [Chitinophagaceae bacterium]
MTKAYNFLASWQLFPEKCEYQNGIVPKSGNYKIESINNQTELAISINWVSIDNQAFYTQYNVVPDGQQRDFANKEIADVVVAEILNTSILKITFFKQDVVVLEVTNEILSNGYMKITQQGIDGSKKTPFVNKEIYHKQLSVLPYAASVTGVAIRPTDEGVIKHKALWAMEEQTNMQLNQIKEQIELLAKQAQEIRKRKEISLMIYEAKLGFKPQIGLTYHLYEKADGSHILSLISPQEWGKSGPFKQFVSSVKLLADHTWCEV